MAGNRVGERRYYGYTSDSGEVYSILTDVDLATAGGLQEDDSSPPPPRRFKPRGVYAEAADGARRYIVCQQSSALYDTDITSTVEIDGESFQTTGRRGESLSFRRNPPAGP